jgi:hypothetical protein
MFAQIVSESTAYKEGLASRHGPVASREWEPRSLEAVWAPSKSKRSYDREETDAGGCGRKSRCVRDAVTRASNRFRRTPFNKYLSISTTMA